MLISCPYIHIFKNNAQNKKASKQVVPVVPCCTRNFEGLISVHMCIAIIPTKFFSPPAKKCFVNLDKLAKILFSQGIAGVPIVLLESSVVIRGR